MATLTGCLAAVIWLLSHRPNRLWCRFTAWWLVSLGCYLLAVALHHDEVTEVAERTRHRLGRLVRGFVRRLGRVG